MCNSDVLGLLPKINAGQVVLNKSEPSPGSPELFRWQEHLPGYMALNPNGLTASAVALTIDLLAVLVGKVQDRRANIAGQKQ